MKCFYAPNPLHGCFDRADDPAKFAGPVTGRTINGPQVFTYPWYVEGTTNMSDREIDNLPRIEIVQAVRLGVFPPGAVVTFHKP